MSQLELRLNRRILTDDYTIGDFIIDKNLRCNTLEDTVRAPGVKIPGKTAIPAGRYEVKMTYSNRFKKVMPQIMDVPGFSGIRIHAGNKAADTEGCLLLGEHKSGGWINQSRDDFDEFLLVMNEHKGPIFITITNP